MKRKNWSIRERDRKMYTRIQHFSNRPKNERLLRLLKMYIRRLNKHRDAATLVCYLPKKKIDVWVCDENKLAHFNKYASVLKVVKLSDGRFKVYEHF